mmetsp:Transcript_4363/g.11487  ORF Transcript_4363/g.11487 Transcript_4363/m.11487 type:complete len:153 (+) Transcript_4363:718-1176(+)
MLMGFQSPESIGRCSSPGGAWGLSHFVRMFRDDTRRYIMKVIERVRPAMVIVCMIYFPDEQKTGSWADGTLAALGYNGRPEKLQAAIRKVYELATCAISGTIEGTLVVPLPFFAVLDGKDTSLYVDRVEPSGRGGERMARTIWETIKANTRT